MFTIPIRRWIASEDNPADEPSRSKRYRPSTHSGVDQCRPSATRSASDAELAVLSAEAARVASEETQARKQSASRSCGCVTNQNRGSRFASDAKKEGVHELEHTFQWRVWPVSIPSSTSRPSSSRTESPQLRSNATRPRSTSSWPLQKMSLDELKLLAKLDEMVVEMLEHMYFQGYGHGEGDYLMAAIKFVGWI